MRSKLIIWSLFLLCVHTATVFAQSYPEDWKVYQSPKYFCCFQSGTNPDGMPIETYLEALTSAAISGLARQMEVQVSETAELEKTSINGTSSVSYSSHTSYSTDVKLKLVNTKTQYNKREKLWYAIAYIEKQFAISFFTKEIEDNLSTAERIYNNAKDLISLGYKEKAKNELNEATKCFSKTEEAFYWLKMSGLSNSEYSSILGVRHNIENLITQALIQLGHNTTLYIKCSADCFGAKYGQLENDLKSKLSSEDRSFVTNKATADWIIDINASAREYNAVSYGSLSSYFSYVDANCTIFKAATSQMIFEGSFSEKGGSTINYEDSAKDAYRRIVSKILGIIEENIE